MHGLFGMTGCGKTSLINSFKFAAAGNLGRHTMYRKAVHITNGIYVVENRCLDNATTDAALAEIEQLDGKRGYSDVVEWQKNKKKEGDALDGDVEYATDCAVLVFSARHDIQSNTDGLKKVVDLLHKLQGRYPMAVITHIDLDEDSRVKKLRTFLEVNAGISDIFEVANITKENETLEEAYQYRLLLLLEKCMVDGDKSYINKYYQGTERASGKNDKDDIVEKLNEKVKKMEKTMQEKEKGSNVTVDGPRLTAVIATGAATGATMGFFAGPVGAAVGGAIGGVMMGAGYLFGTQEKSGR